jgi:hypothetical protein
VEIKILQETKSVKWYVPIIPDGFQWFGVKIHKKCKKCPLVNMTFLQYMQLNHIKNMLCDNAVQYLNCGNMEVTMDDAMEVRLH